jgi:A/G-specific adenine glycosylase
LLAWFAAHARDLPWRRTRDPYAIWVSEIMLQQTQVATVIPYWERWMRQVPTLQMVAKARPAKLRKLWEGLGYYTRVRNLQRAARQIVEQHAGEFPRDFDDILTLPGVGRYTAGAIASIAYNEPKPILDGNVVRVLTRLWAIRSDPHRSQTRARLWQLAETLVVEASRSKRHAAACSHLNQSLMELGAVICVPRQPRCEVCPLARLCVGRERGIAPQLPITGRRATPILRRVAMFVVRRGERVLVRQRPGSGVNAHFWELPQVELQNESPDLAREARAALGVEPAGKRPLCELAHSVTRHRFRIEVFTGERTRRLAGGRWFSPTQLRQAAFAGADRKVLTRLKLT